MTMIKGEKFKQWAEQSAPHALNRYQKGISKRPVAPLQYAANAVARTRP
jgi:hypothetical protein